jgi:hypothetical protein
MDFIYSLFVPTPSDIVEGEALSVAVDKTALTSITKNGILDLLDGTDIDKEKFYQKLIEEKYIIQPVWGFFSYSGDKFDLERTEEFKQYLQRTKFETNNNTLPKKIDPATISKIVHHCQTMHNSIIYSGGKSKRPNKSNRTSKSKRPNKSKRTTKLMFRRGN